MSDLAGRIEAATEEPHRREPVHGRGTKLDRTFEGCGDAASGEELVALAVEDLTGIGVGNSASFRTEAFANMVDSVGGVEVCVSYALREGVSDLLAAGCSQVDGKAALLWVESRTQEFVSGEWRFVDGVGDAARVERQQMLVFALLAELKTIESPTELAGLAEDLGNTIVLDETFWFGDAVSMVWDPRSVASGGINAYGSY